MSRSLNDLTYHLVSNWSLTASTQTQLYGNVCVAPRSLSSLMLRSELAAQRFRRASLLMLLRVIPRNAVSGSFIGTETPHFGSESSKRERNRSNGVLPNEYENTKRTVSWGIHHGRAPVLLHSPIRRNVSNKPTASGAEARGFRWGPGRSRRHCTSSEKHCRCA